MAELMKEIRQKIKQRIKELDTSQAELAQKLGEERAWVNHRVTGRTAIQVEDLVRMAAGLSLAAWDLLPDPPPLNVEKMSLIDLIKTIVKDELENYLKDYMEKNK